MPQTHPQPAAKAVPQGLCGHGLVQGLLHEGLQVSKQGNCMHHQLLGWVVLREDREGGGGSDILGTKPHPGEGYESPSLASASLA